MNRLQLCQRVRELAGIPGIGPSSTLSQVGELGRVVHWVDDAWAEIQIKHKWGFLWEASSVVIAQSTYKTAGSIPAHRYIKNKVYDGTRALDYLPFEQFSALYPLAQIADGTPAVWTIQPDRAFAVNAKPTANLTLSVERYTNPVAMTADASEPSLPTEHRMAIVYKALLLYANFEEAGVTRATAQAEFNRHLAELGMNELPDMVLGAALC